jgi:hypothetical protein
LPPDSVGAEVGIVTDCGENPTTSRALIDQPLFAKPQEVTIKTAEGKTVTFQSPASVSVRKGQAGNPREAKLFAVVGEYEPFSFLLRPAEALSQVPLPPATEGPKGPSSTANVMVRSVESFHEGSVMSWCPSESWDVGGTEFFWCTVKCPMMRNGSWGDGLTASGPVGP